MKKLNLICLSLIFAASFIAAAEKEIFNLKDPAGDDQGDGSLVYPLRDDLKAGDLDIVALSAHEQDGGTLFEATFAKKITDPGQRAIDAGGTALNKIARYGFYTFNIDIYIDTDRKAGSGRTDALPGRNVTIAREDAWDKAIVVTPRPYEATSILKRILQKEHEDNMQKQKGRVDPADEVEIQGKVARHLQDSYFFPTRMRVVGNRLTFFVPASFLGGTAKPEWSYVVAVSAADIYQKVDLGSMVGMLKAEPGVMILSVSPGNWRDHFGGAREGDFLKPPLVDIIVPQNQKQEDILRSYNLNERRPAQLSGVIPSAK